MFRRFLLTFLVAGMLCFSAPNTAEAKCSVHSADALVTTRYTRCKPGSLVSYLYNNIVTPYSFSCAKRIVTTCVSENCENPATPEDRARCEEEYVAVLNACNKEIDYAATMASCKDTKFWKVAQDDGTQALVAVQVSDISPTVVYPTVIATKTAGVRPVTAPIVSAPLQVAVAAPIKLPRPGEALPSTTLAMNTPRVGSSNPLGQSTLKTVAQIVIHPAAQTATAFEKDLPMTTVTLSSQNPHEPSQTVITFRPHNLVQPLEAQAAARRVVRYGNYGNYGAARLTAADDDVAIVRIPRSPPVISRETR